MKASLPTRMGLVLFLAVAAAECNSPTATVVNGCSGIVAVTVTQRAQATPSAQWTPGCGITAAVVTDLTVDATVWAFNVPERMPVGPPLIYGFAPTRANVWQSPIPLVAGHTYRVRLVQTVGLDVSVGGGETTFVF